MSKKVLSKIAKMLFVVTLTSTVLEARFINGIALLVNSEPITMYEIEKTVQMMKVDRQQAIDFLIDQKIEDNAVKSFSIIVDDKEIDDKIFQNALKFQMSQYDFEKYLASKGVDIQEYKDDLRQKIEKERLLRIIVGQSVKEPTQNELKDYYQSNIALYNIPESIKVSRYESKNVAELTKFVQTPLVLREGISMKSELLKKDVIKNDDFWLMLSLTPQKSFTQIIPTENGGFYTFFVVEKNDIKKLSFEQSSSLVRMRYLKEQEDRVIEDFYKKQRASADIKIVGEK